MDNSGKFVISLDFELMWGVRDSQTIDTYGENILGVWEILPLMLKIFDKYEIGATFAVVGFLFAENKDELLASLPVVKPQYKDYQHSPYSGYFDSIPCSERGDLYHFAKRLIDLILKHPQHEIATHTLSHYECLDPGQSKVALKDDLNTALKIAGKSDIEINSVVFPKNHFNSETLGVLEDLGISCYRGGEKAWYKQPNIEKENQIIRKVLRIVDTYINLSGHNCYDVKVFDENLPINIPSSAFLRPFSVKLKRFENMKVKRILNSMTYAAKKNLVYHLWWHPHNFGVNQEQNFENLNKILNHYDYLNSKYGFKSYTMKDLSNLIKA